VFLLVGLSLDGQLSRVDGVLLLASYPLMLYALTRFARHGLDVRPVGELADRQEAPADHGRLAAVAVLVAALAGITLGSAALVYGVRHIVTELDLSQTAVGMTLLAAAVSIEELARTVPAAMRGHPEISVGNLVGSVLAFLLCNAGAIALVRPLGLDTASRYFYLPYTAVTVLVICALLLRRGLARWAGLAMILGYAGFVIGAARI